MNNVVKPIPCEIFEVKHETEFEWTFKTGSGRNINE